jgi:hypothetical protein
MVGSRMGRALTLAISAIAFAFVVPLAAADSVYHTEHLALRPVGDAPLRSGSVTNIKAQGPMVYAHEVYVLNGALPDETYTVTNNFHYLSPDCSDNDYPFDTAVMTTGPDGNARAEAKFTPADVAGFQGVSGVFWTVRDSDGDVVYETECTAVTLD